MWPFVCLINGRPGLRTLASCCGHGKYPPTVVVLNVGLDCVFEWFTGAPLKRYYKNGKANRQFYARDDEGVYCLVGLHYPG
jgi:hypothetical protein